jgi:aminoglycoside phosphotransferase (APT) family kinase protein
VSELDVAAIVAAALPGHEPRSVELVDAGWDSIVLDVDGAWIIRVARQTSVAETYATEARLLAALAPTLPAPVPRIALPAPDVGVYRKLQGERIDGHDDEPGLGAELGRFLRALHAFPVERAATLGARQAWRAEHADDLAPALRLLGVHERARGEQLLDGYRRLRFEPAVVHADLGPEHVLCRNGHISGVIDWGDAGIGDPAIDAVWAVFDAAEPFRDAFVAAYGVDDATLARAAVFWRVVPWHEVRYGLATNRPEHIERGLAGVRARLPAATGDPDTMAR